MKLIIWFQCKTCLGWFVSNCGYNLNYGRGPNYCNICRKEQFK